MSSRSYSATLLRFGYSGGGYGANGGPGAVGLGGDGRVGSCLSASVASVGAKSAWKSLQS